MLFLGDQYGQLNLVEFYKKQVQDSKGQSSKNKPVRHITMSASQDLYFSTSNVIYHQPPQDQLQCYDIVSSAKIIGLDIMNDKAIYSCSDGGIYRLTCEDPEEEDDQEYELFHVGVAEGWQKGFLESAAEPNQYCLIGSKIPPVVVDFNKEVIKWGAKNVPNDQLQLKVPINDVDGVFYNDCNNLAISHRDRKIRLYDVKKGQRRPILNAQYSDEKSNFTRVLQSLCKNYFYVSNAQGSVFVCDKRKDLKVCGKFKGANGTITDMKVLPERYLLTTSLDSYVRLYNTEDNKLLTNFYIGAPLYSIYTDIETVDEDQMQDFLEVEEEKSKVKVKAPKRKNTIQLPYLARKQQKKQEHQQDSK